MGIQNKGTRNWLLQEPPSTVDEAIAVARRYEAAKSTLDTLKHENCTRSAVINPVRSGKICFICQNPGHITRDCARKGFVNEKSLCNEHWNCEGDRGLEREGGERAQGREYDGLTFMSSK